MMPCAGTAGAASQQTNNSRDWNHALPQRLTHNMDHVATGPFTQATGPFWSDAGVGFGWLRGEFLSFGLLMTDDYLRPLSIGLLISGVALGLPLLSSFPLSFFFSFFFFSSFSSVHDSLAGFL